HAARGAGQRGGVQAPDPAALRLGHTPPPSWTIQPLPSSTPPSVCLRGRPGVAARRPWGQGVHSLGLWFIGAPLPSPGGDQGGVGGPGRLLLEVLPGPPSPGRRSGAGGGRQPPLRPQHRCSTVKI